MSVKFKLSEISAEEQKKIYKYLVFKPEEPKFNRGGANYYQGSSASINMFYTENKIVRLPYRFACSFYKKIFNNDKEYPKIFEDQNGKFSGRLLERQIEPMFLNLLLIDFQQMFRLGLLQ